MRRYTGIIFFTVKAYRIRLFRLWDKLSAGESIGVILKCTVIELVSQLNQQWSPSADVRIFDVFMSVTVFLVYL